VGNAPRRRLIPVEKSKRNVNSQRNYLNNSNIETINPSITLGKIKFAIFKYDGIIPLIREGWQQIMIPMVV